MSKIRFFLTREALVRKQRREISVLKTELSELQRQNESMRTGMRRCLTCEYRDSATRQ
ncbi:MAG: hypothetical protein HOC70_05355 [Gammaproteobacteria bacterium]|nr:hypothetical protein [Gammaproteobacteria bacterium]